MNLICKGAYLLLSCECKVCKIGYNIKLNYKPGENDEHAVAIVTRNKDHKEEHHSKVPRPRITGEEREKVATEVILRDNGSAKNYNESMAGSGNTNLSSDAAIRKVVSEFVNREMVSTNWITNIMHTAEMSREDSCNKNIKGYVQRANLMPDFTMTLELEESYRAYGLIPANQRLMHLDASGKLVSII